MGHGHSHSNEKKTQWVVFLTAITMVVEIIFGIWSGSMALLADGIHMGSHVMAIGLSWLAYVLVRRLKESDKFTGDSSKILSLSGYTSGILLLLFAVFILFEAGDRYFHPVSIKYKEAIRIAVIGLVVNLISALLLHHDHEHSDHNIRGAYLHVLADALTSVSAIIGLLIAQKWDLVYVDIIVAVLSSVVIIKWSFGLLKETGKTLLNI